MRYKVNGHKATAGVFLAAVGVYMAAWLTLLCLATSVVVLTVRALT